MPSAITAASIQEVNRGIRVTKTVTFDICAAEGNTPRQGCWMQCLIKWGLSTVSTGQSNMET